MNWVKNNWKKIFGILTFILIIFAVVWLSIPAEPTPEGVAAHKKTVKEYSDKLDRCYSVVMNVESKTDYLECKDFIDEDKPEKWRPAEFR